MVSYSPLLTPNCGTQQCPGAAAFYSDTLYYIGNGHDPTIWILSRTCTADSLNPAEDPDDEQNYWTQKQLQNEPNFQNFEGGCGTAVPPACAVAGDYLYFVWIQLEGTSSHNQRVFATRLEPASGGGSMAWSAPVCLADGDGSPLVMPSKKIQISPIVPPDFVTLTTFAVTAWGDYLIACYKGKEEVSLLVYDTGDWPSQSAPATWNASSQWGTDFSGWPSFPAYADLGDQISMDWFTPGGAQPGTASAAPAIYLIISFFNPEKNHAYIWHAMDLTPLDQWSGAQPFKQWQVENRPMPGKDVKGVNVIRDPAGRMRAYSCDSVWDNAIQYDTMATNQVSSDGYCWTTFGSDWEVLYGSAGRQSADQAPIPAFVMGPSTTEGGQTVSQVYEFLLFKNDGINLVFSHFGEAVRIPDAYTLNFNEKCLKPGEKAKLVATGIVDSPLPMPAANLQGRSITGTLGSVDYGTTESEGDQRSTSWSWSAGFMSEGYATDGAGPAWDISFNAGMAGATGHSETTQIATALISSTNADLPPQGNYFHGGVIFHRDEYLFYDVNLDGTTSKTPVSNAPTITSIWIEYTGLANDSLQSYANTAGNLWSYTKAGWNARMQQLGYAGDNYFDDVILAQDKNGDYVNAVVFGEGADASPFLEFAWSTSGAVIQKFNDVSTTFEESGWHMEASVYVGYSFAIGASIFGVGEKEFGELLVGGSYSRTTEDKTTEGKSWGITVDYAPPSPPSIPYPGQVTALSWKLYLLKANQQWTDELIQYGDPTFKDQIDPNSAPWRIVFEVDPDSIVFQGDNRNLVYRDEDGQIIEAWYYPGSPYSYGGAQQAQEGTWSWTNLTTAATAADGSGGTLPAVAGEPCWFAWGLSQPGAVPYTQAVVFRSASGDLYLLWSDRYNEGSGQDQPKIAWTWRNLATIEGFVKAAGDPVGFHWERNPWGPNLHVIYRGVDGDLHEIHVPWTDQADGAWKTDNLAQALPAEQKPASDPCAVVWNEDPRGPSEHVFYRANNNQIYGMYYDRQTKWRTQTAVSELTHDGATPTGKPCAFVWNGGGSPSLHVGYRGSTGEIHDLFRQSGTWQPATDPSYAAHATAADQRAAEAPIGGFAWERRAVPQTIHWYYLTSEGDVCELRRGVGGPSHWGWVWVNLSQEATSTQGSGKLPPVAAIVQGYAWYFDPVAGSSMCLYLRAQDGAVYELRYVPTDGPTSPSGAWEWTELTGWVTDAAGNPLPNAASASG